MTMQQLDLFSQQPTKSEAELTTRPFLIQQIRALTGIRQSGAIRSQDYLSRDELYQLYHWIRRKQNLG